MRWIALLCVLFAGPALADCDKYEAAVEQMESELERNADVLEAAQKAQRLAREEGVYSAMRNAARELAEISRDGVRAAEERVRAARAKLKACERTAQQ